MNLINRFKRWWFLEDHNNEWMRTDPVSGETRPSKGWLSTDKDRVAQFVAEVDAATEQVTEWAKSRRSCTCSHPKMRCSSCPTA